MFDSLSLLVSLTHTLLLSNRALQCKCPIGYEGTHCEFRHAQSSIIKNSEEKHGEISTAAKLICAAGILAVLVVTSWLLCFRSDKEDIRQNESEDAGAAVEETGYRLDPDPSKAPTRSGALATVEIL